MTMIEFVTIIGTFCAIFALGYKCGEHHEKSNRSQSEK